MITGKGSLKAAGKEHTVFSEKGDLVICGQDVQFEGPNAITLYEGKCYFEEGTTALTGKLTVQGILLHPNVKITSARDTVGKVLDTPRVGLSEFYAKKSAVHTVKISDTVETPEVKPLNGSEVEAGELARASCPTENAQVFYTTDGSDPFVHGEIYQEPIPIYEGIQLRLGAKSSGLKNSAVIEAGYTIRKHRLIWQLDGEIWGEIAEKTYGESIQTPNIPEKEGYTFTGWKDVPETMPAQDLIVQGKYHPNRYTFTCQIQNQIYARDTYFYQSPVKKPATPARFGYDFSGWGEIPETMPARDVVLKGNWRPKRFRFCCLLEGRVYAADWYDYESSIKTPASPARIGYTFSGWGEIPAKMPAHNVILEGTFRVHTHTLTWLLDGEIVARREVAYGTPLIPEAVEKREGYTFSGWSPIPLTMPDQNVDIYGSFSRNVYSVTWLVDGQVFAESKVPYGESIPKQEIPQKEGYRFCGWEDIPEIMPAQNLTLTGKFVPNQYTLSVWVDGEPYAQEPYACGSKVAIPPSPVREGYTFSGWNEIPTVMPAKDVMITGRFTVNHYSLTYQVDEETAIEKTYAYGESIPLPENPQAEGKEFEGWSPMVPTVMPAHDVRIQALWRAVPVNLSIEAVICDAETIRTGEAATWTTRAVGGDGKYIYRYHVQKDGKKLSSFEFTPNPVFHLKAEEPGVYRVRVYVKDGSGKQVTKISANLTVRKEKDLLFEPNEPLSIVSIQSDQTIGQVGTPITWKASAAGGSGQYIYRYHLLKDGVKHDATEFIEEDTYSYTPQEPGVYCVRLFVKNREKKGKQVTKQSANIKISE